MIVCRDYDYLQALATYYLQMGKLCVPRKNKEAEDLLYCIRCVQSVPILLNKSKYCLKGSTEFEKSICVVCKKKKIVKLYKF